MNTLTKEYGRKADATSASAAATKAADAKDAKLDAKEVTNDELTTAIKAAFAEATKGLTLKVDEAAVAKIIKDELAKAQGDSKAISPEAAGAAAKAAIEAVLNSNRLPGKNVLNAADAQNKGGQDINDANGDRGQIEIPYALRKGNLPLHMKQLVNVLLRKEENDGIDEKDLAKGKRLSDKMWDGMSSMGVKALTIGGDGTGSEWVPRLLSDELYRRLYLESQIAQAFLASEVQMPSNPYDFPLLTTNPTFYLNNVENTVPPASDTGTAKFTLTAQRLMALCQFSYESNEDSIIPLMPAIQTALARAGAIALENSLINGDTTATHFDTGYTVSSNDVRRAWKGLRKLATAGSLTVDFSTGGLIRSNLIQLPKALGKWGVNTKDLLWVVGTNGWASLLALDEVALAYARGATPTYIAGGPTPCPFGGQIVVSEQMPENLNANGIYDNSVTSKGSILVFNKAQFVLGSRREFTVEVDRNIKSQTHEVVVSFRKAFTPMETPSSTIKTVAIARNYPA